MNAQLLIAVSLILLILLGVGVTVIFMRDKDVPGRHHPDVGDDSND